MELAQQQEWDEGSGICGGNVGKKNPQTHARERNNLNFESLALTGKWSGCGLQRWREGFE